MASSITTGWPTTCTRSNNSNGSWTIADKDVSEQTQAIRTKGVDKYKAELEVDETRYKGLQVTVPREGKKPLVATWGGISAQMGQQGNP